ncbi:MAG TPA: hypothetical protein VMV15_08645 [Candidatus Binataceae bacterium]|nr:hypothetical protein [Candidatus Binataceae bacterium]
MTAAETNSPTRTTVVDALRLARRVARAIVSPAIVVLLAAALQLSGCMDPSALGLGGMGSSMGGMGMGGGQSAFGASARTPQERAMAVEPMLQAAGFQSLSPQQPAHQQQLAGLPALKLNTYTTPEGQQRFWYADPDYCHCLYVGDAGAYQRYQSLRLQNQQLEGEQQMQVQQQMQQQQYQMQQYQMQQQQQMGPFGPMGPMGPPMGMSPFGFGMGGPGLGVIF